MKRLYWDPRQVSRLELGLIAILAIVGMFATEYLLVQQRMDAYSEKLAAARLARTAFDVLKNERLRRQLPIDPVTDPSQSGLIGTIISPITSGTGSLRSKQTSINPNFAAVVVHFLKKADVHEGDIIAVGISGSFPALNIAVLSAIQTLKLRPIIISSVAASQWGANHPQFTWLDMEHTLYENGVFEFRSAAATRGGIGDVGIGLSEEGRDVLDQAIMRNGVTLLFSQESNAGANAYEESIEKRMALYTTHANGTPIKAYVNVGGGTVSVGTKVGKRAFQAGLNRDLPRGQNMIPSVMGRFLEHDIPAIHMVRVGDMAARYAFPIAPTHIPDVGQGRIFVRHTYNRWVASTVLLLIIGAMIAFIRLDRGK